MSGQVELEAVAEEGVARWCGQGRPGTGRRLDGHPVPTVLLMMLLILLTSPASTHGSPSTTPHFLAHKTSMHFAHGARPAHSTTGVFIRGPAFVRTLPWHPPSAPSTADPGGMAPGPHPAPGPVYPWPTPRPTPEPAPKPSVVNEVGNLTGPHICSRSVSERRYMWKNLKFECHRKEYVPFGICLTCRAWNATHNIRELQGECTGKVYQYEPVIVNIKQCCDGYQRRNNICAESVNCQLNNGGCPHICLSDKEAGKHCECFQGYQFNGTRCDDFNECTLQNGGCSDNCVNTIGSYYCTCRPARQLISPFTCTNVNQCDINNGGCAHTCKLRNDIHYCICNEGFKLKDGRECQNINKFEGDVCKQGCQNSIVSYTCLCPQGKLMKAKNVTCGVAASSKQYTDLSKSPLLIAIVLCVSVLILLVSCVWIICCYVKGLCCCQDRHKSGRSSGNQDLMMKTGIGNCKENGHVNPGYAESTMSSYNYGDSSAQNAMHDKAEVVYDLGKVPGDNSATQNGRNARHQESQLS